MADSNSIVGSIGLDIAEIKASLQQLTTLLTSASTSTKKLDEETKKATTTTKAAASATREQLDATRIATAESKKATAQSREKAAAIAAETAEIRKQNAELTLAAKQQSAAAREARKAAASGPTAKSGRGGMGQAGNVAMQAQDIAVSLQGGMHWAQVMGQQGSQLLSIFGPTGMLVGGAVAIGAALYTALKPPEASLQILNERTKELDKAFKGAFGSLDASKLESFSSLAGDKLDELDEKMKNLNSPGWGEKFLSSTLGNVLTLGVGGEAAKNLQANRAIEGQLVAAEQLGLKLKISGVSAKILDLAEEEVRIMELKAQGQIGAARAAENELELQKDLAKMRNSANAKISPGFEREARKQIEKKHALKESIRLAEEEAEKQREHDEQQKKDFEAFEKDRREEEEKTAKHHADIRAFNADMEARFAKERAEQEEKDAKAEERRIEEAAKLEEKQRNEATKQSDKVKVLETEISLGDQAAKRLERDLRLRQEIVDAQNDHNQALEEQLRKEQQLLQVKDAIEEQLKTPEQKKAERDQAREERKAARIVAARARRIEQAAKNAGFGGIVKPADKAAGVPNINPNAPAAGAAGAAAGNQMKVDTLVVKVLKHG